MFIIQSLKLFVIYLIFGLVSLLPQKTIFFGIIDNPNSFIPSETNTDGEKIISDLIFRKLFKFEEGELVNDLVSDWSMDQTKTQYTIKLKKNQKWQDLSEINSNDVIYTLSKKEGLKNEIEIEKVSDYEVKIKLNTPTAILPQLLTFGLEPAHIPRQNRLKPVGSTSYRVARVQIEQNRLESVILQSLKKDKSYPRLAFRFYKTENDLFTAYKLGEINTFVSASNFSWDGLDSSPITYLGRYFTVIYNSQSEKLNEPETREVLSKTLDVNKLFERSYHSTSIKAQGPLSYSSYTKDTFLLPIYDPNAKLTPEKQKIVKDLKIILPNNPDGNQIESFLRESWEKSLGINLTFTYYDLSELIDKGREGSYDVMFIGLEVSPDPDRYVFWHSSQINKFNFGKFQDARADKSLEEGSRESDYEKRLIHYNIFQDVVATKYPAVFLYHPGTNLYHNKQTVVPTPKLIYNPSDILKNL